MPDETFARLELPLLNLLRKYYVLTRRGEQALGDARAKITELMGEVLEPRESARASRTQRRHERTTKG